MELSESTVPTTDVNGLESVWNDGRRMAVNPVRINRKRYMELAQLANETCVFLESKGLRKGEQCLFSRIAQELWFSE